MARRQTTIWTNTRVLSIGILRTNFSENLRFIYFSLKKNVFENVICKMTALLLSLNVSTQKRKAMCQNRAGTSPTLRASGWSRIDCSSWRPYWETIMQTYILHLLITDTPYLALTGETWGVCCEKLREHSSCHHGTEQHMHIQSMYPHIYKPYLTCSYYAFLIFRSQRSHWR